MLQSMNSENREMLLRDGRHLSFAAYGDEQGFPVIFCHGWPSSRCQAAYLDGQAKALGLRVISPDRPGVGNSSRCPRSGFAEWTRDLTELVDDLGISRFAVFGVSGGGPYALATSLELADRVVCTAVVCGAPPLNDPEDRANMHWAYRTLASMRRLRRWAFPKVVKMSDWMLDRGVDQPPMSWMLRSIPAVDREAIKAEEGWDMVVRSYREAFANGPDGPLAEGELYLQAWDFDPSGITIPVGFWHGLDDANLPCEAAKKLAGRIVGAETHWIADEGHYSLPLHYSQEVLEWLRKAFE